MNLKRALSLTVLAATLAFGSAQAGGLFGDGGLIRGWVGERLDPIENSVTTPLARRGVEVGGAAVGSMAAGMMGAPPELGAFAGRCMGRSMNSAFAGRGAAPCIGRRFEAVAGPPLGNFCHTSVGVFGPGPLNPIGSPCWAATQWGDVRGRVGR